MSWFEKFAIKKSDVIVSNLQNYGQHLKDDLKIHKEFTWISNGVDLDALNQIEELNIKIKNQIPKDKFIVGYMGTIGVANAMDSFCQTAKILKDNSNIVFAIVGNGQEKDSLIKKYNYLDNILFVDAIPKKQVQSMLGLFDVCYIGLRKENLFKYGVSPNKLFDYMYSSKPIVYAIESGESNIVKLTNCGVNVEAQNPQAIADGISELFNMTKEQRNKLGKNGKDYVLEHFTYKKLANEYQKIIK
jgi:glycosyltransferase involved in cell wall biosynthesis